MLPERVVSFFFKYFELLQGIDIFVGFFIVFYSISIVQFYVYFWEFFFVLGLWDLIMEFLKGVLNLNIIVWKLLLFQVSKLFFFVRISFFYKISLHWSQVKYNQVVLECSLESKCFLLSSIHISNWERTRSRLLEKYSTAAVQWQEGRDHVSVYCCSSIWRAFPLDFYLLNLLDDLLVYILIGKLTSKSFIQSFSEKLWKSHIFWMHFFMNIGVFTITRLKSCLPDSYSSSVISIGL